MNLTESKKAFVAFNDEDVVMINRICVDKDPEDALYFVMKRIVPKLKKQLPCLAGQLMKADRR